MVTTAQANSQPVFTSIPYNGATQDIEYSYTIKTSDPDNDTVDISLQPNPALDWLSVTTTINNGDGTASAVLSGTPDAGDLGAHNLELQVEDAEGGTTSQTFTLTVSATNLLPSVFSPPDIIISVNSPGTAVSLSGADPDGTVVRYGIYGFSPASKGLFYSDAAFTNLLEPSQLIDANPDQTGTVYFKPATDFVGWVRIFYYSVDNTGAEASSRVPAQVTISADHNPPVANDDPAYQINRDSVLAIAATVGVLANDTDANDDPLTAILQSGPTNGDLVLNDDGSFTYTPDFGFLGSDSFSYFANDGIENSTTAASVSIAVVDPPPNLPPIFTTGDPTDTDIVRDLPFSHLIETADPENDDVTISLTDTTKWWELTTTVNNADATANATLSGTPGISDIGDHFIELSVDDHNGNVVFQSFTISVRLENLPPNALSAPPQIVDEDTPVVSMKLRGEDPDGTVIQFRIDRLSDTSKGVFYLNAALETPLHEDQILNADITQDLTIYFQPAANYVGDALVHFVAIDDDGAEGANRTNRQITMSAVADKPVAADDTGYDVLQNGTLFIDATSGVLVNDTDVDGDALTAILATGPANGSLTLNGDGSYSYSPNPEFTGIDGFTYFANDGSENSATSALVTITVLESGFNLPPSFDSAGKTGALQNLHYSYSVEVSDFNDDELTISVVDKPGWLDLSTTTNHADNTASAVLSGTPTPSDVGSHPVELTVNDGQGGIATQNFTIDVAATNVRPVTADPVDITINEDEYPIPVVLSGSDSDGYVTGFFIDHFTDETIGVFYTDIGLTDELLDNQIVSADGSESATVYFRPATDYHGSARLFYVAIDNRDEKDRSRERQWITIHPVNDAPIFQTETDLASAEIGASYSVTIGATDIEDDDVGFTIVSGPDWLDIESFQNNASDNTATVTLSASSVDGVAGETVSIVLNVSDGEEATGQTFNLTLVPANSPPTFVTGTGLPDATQEEDYNTQIITQDVDGDNATITTLEKPSWADVSLTSNGPDGQASVTVTGRPTNTHVGPQTLTLEVSDSIAPAVTERTFAFNVINTNDAPTFLSPVALDDVTEDEAQTIVIVAEDVDDDDLTATLVNGDGWLTLVSVVNDDSNEEATITLTGTPRNEHVGTRAIQLEVSDGDPETPATAKTFNISVINVNDVPTFSPKADETIDEDSDFSYFIVASDVDVGDSLEIGYSAKPDWLSFEEFGSGTARIFGTPENDDVGTHEITLTLTDHNIAFPVEQTFTVTVANTNDAPMASGLTLTDNEDAGPFLITLSGSDEDPEDSIQHFVIDELAGLNGQIFSSVAPGTPLANGDIITASGNAAIVSFAPNTHFNGETSFTFAAVDQSGAESELATVSVVLAPEDDAPQFTIGGSLGNVDEDTPYSIDITVVDFDGNDLTISADGSLGWLTLSATTDNGDGSFTATLSATPENDDVGTLNFDIEITGGSGGPVSQSFSITVTNTNDTPTFATSALLPVAEEDALHIITITTNDVDGDDVDAYLVEDEFGNVGDGWLALKSLTNHSDGTATIVLEGTPTNTHVGNRSFVLALTDHTILTPETRTFSLTVTNTNDAPYALALTLSGTEDEGPFSITLSGDDDDLFDSVDAFIIKDVDDLNGQLFDPATPGTALASGMTIAASGNMATISFHPTMDFYGTTSFTYAAIDQDGEEGAPETVSVTLSPDEDDPVFLTSAALGPVEEDALYSLNVIVRDPDGDTLTITPVGDLGWLNHVGTVDNGDNTFTATYEGTPENDDVGTLNFTLRADDGNEDGPTITQAFSITVTNTNDAPEFPTDTFLPDAEEDTQYTATVTIDDVDGDDIIATLSDPEGDGDDDWLAIHSVFNNGNGTSTITLKGTPLNDHVGDRSFQLTITDSNIGTPIDATFTLAVTNVNDATVAMDDGVVTDEDTAVSGNVLDNDVDVDTPPGMLAVILVTDVSEGTLVLSSNGDFTYSPGLNFNGQDTFTYKVNDGVDDSDDATVTIDVGAVDDPPEITAPSNQDEVDISILEGAVLVTDVDASDVESDTLTFEIVAGAGDHDKFTIDPSNGVLSFTAAPDFETPADSNIDNVYDVTVRVSDASGFDTLVVHVTIGDFDEIAPTVTLSAPAETREPFDVIVTFSEPVTGLELNELTVVNGAVTALSGEGATYTFTVAPTDTGKVTFQLAANVASDAAGNGNLASALAELDYVDEEATREEAQEVIGQLMTQRNRITMDYKPSIRRRLQRLTGGLDNNGGISAFGLTYKDGRLPVNVIVKEDEVSFAYSLRRSQALAPAPSLRGRLAVGPFGEVSSKTPAKNKLDGEPLSLSDNHSLYDQRADGEESAALHDALFGTDNRKAPGKNQDNPHVVRNSRQTYPALSQLDFESRHSAPQAKIEDRRLDLWVEGTFGEFDIDGSVGTFGVMHVGADYLYTPDIMVGFSTQVDIVESETPDNGTSSEGVGYMVGPYATIRLSPKLLFDGRLSWGRSRNSLTSSDMIKDEFASERWLVSAALVGKVDITQHFTVLPEARLSWYREDSESYTNGLDVEIPSSAVETGSFEFGPTIRGTIPYGFDGKFQPFASFKGIWTFANNQYSAGNFEHPPHTQTGVRARFDIGFDFTPSSASGRTLSISGFLDGIGDKDYEVWGATVRLKQRF